MRHGRTLLAALLIVGCTGDSWRAPTATPPAAKPTSNTPTRTGWLWVMVVDQSGVCIPGATVAVVRGQDSGLVVTPAPNCDVWAADGGYFIDSLLPFDSLTLRGSANGYADKETTVAPNIGSGHATFLDLTRVTK